MRLFHNRLNVLVHFDMCLTFQSKVVCLPMHSSVHVAPPLNHLQTWWRSVSLVVPAMLCLQKSIHQQKSWEPTMTLVFPTSFGLLPLCLSLLSAPLRIGDASTLKGILIFTVFYCKLQLAILMMARYVTPHLLSSMKVINLEMPLSRSFFFLELFFSSLFPLCFFSLPSIWFKHIFTNIVFKPCPFIF